MKFWSNLDNSKGQLANRLCQSAASWSKRLVLFFQFVYLRLYWRKLRFPSLQNEIRYRFWQFRHQFGCLLCNLETWASRAVVSLVCLFGACGMAKAGIRQMFQLKTTLNYYVTCENLDLDNETTKSFNFLRIGWKLQEAVVCVTLQNRMTDQTEIKNMQCKLTEIHKNTTAIQNHWQFNDKHCRKQNDHKMKWVMTITDLLNADFSL